LNDVQIKNIMNDMETKKDGGFFNLKSKMVWIEGEKYEKSNKDIG
jgi:hypothetical protein